MDIGQHMNQRSTQNEASRRSKQASARLRIKKRLMKASSIASAGALTLPCPDAIFPACYLGSFAYERDIYGILPSGHSSLTARLGRLFAFGYLKGGDAEAGM